MSRFAWLLGYYPPATPVLRNRVSINDGSSWSTIDFPTNPPYAGEQPDVLHGTSYYDIWFTGGDRVLHWNGTSFDYVGGVSTSYGQANGIWCVDDDYVWYCGAGSSGGRTWLWQSGTGWVQKTLPDNGNGIGSAYNIWAYDRNNAWACGYASVSLVNRARIWRWNGSVWSVVFRSEDYNDGNPAHTYTGSYGDVCGSSTGDVWVGGSCGYAGGQSNYGLVQYNGSSWVPRYNPPTDSSYVISSLRVTGGNYGHLVRGSAGTGRLCTFSGGSITNRYSLPWPYGNSHLTMTDQGGNGQYDATWGVYGHDNYHRQWSSGSWSTLSVGQSGWDFSGYTRHNLFVGYYDGDPPYHQNEFPAPAQQLIPINSTITLEIVDELSGVDEPTVILKVDGVTAYSGSTAQPGFAVTVTPVSSPSYTGYQYVIDPVALFDAGATVTVYVYAKDLDPQQNLLEDSYVFHTVPASRVDIDNIMVVAKDVVRIKFTGSVSLTPSYYDPTGYTLVPIDGDEIEILGILPMDGISATYVFFRLSRHAFGESFQITINDGTIMDTNGRPLISSTATWIANRTKVDSVLASMAQMYGKSQGDLASAEGTTNLRAVLQAMMISDEEIGGEIPQVREPELTYGGNWGTFHWGTGNWGG